MTAIQRWYFYRDYDGTDTLMRGEPPAFEAGTQRWCKAEDVAQLELLLKRYLEDLATSRQSRDRAKADLAIADAKIKSLEAEIIERSTSASRPVLDIIHMELNTAKIHGYSEEHLDAILADCPDGECVKCAYIICPHKDGMHFHHDGCPSCGAHDEQITGT